MRENERVRMRERMSENERESEIQVIKRKNMICTLFVRNKRTCLKFDKEGK